MVTFEKETTGDYIVWDFCIYRKEDIILGNLMYNKEFEEFIYEQSMAKNITSNDLEEIKNKLMELNK